MAFRFQRSIKLMPGVRLNFSKTGIGASFGVPGLRVGYGPRGRTRSVGIPGTGMSWRETKSYGSSKKRRSGSQSVAPPPPPRPRKPGWFAPKLEKEFCKALEEMTVTSIGQMATKYSEVRASMGALAGMMCLQSGDTNDFAEARKWLELAWSTGREPNSEPVARKYMNFGVEMTVTVAAGVQTQAGLTREAIALALVEIYQQAGELDLAIDLIDGEQINSIAAVSLAELFILKECFDEVIDMTDGITNEDDATALLCVFRGISLREQDMFVAAREAFKEALRIRSRNVEVRNRAWIERSACYLAEGKRGMARNDLERIMAVDSDYPGLIEALENLQGETPEESPEAD